MRFLLTGGGSAGHINPALAIAEALQKADPEAEILFMGTPGGMEKELVAEAGYPMRFVRVQGFRRSLSLKNLQALFLAFTSPLEAKKHLLEFRPHAVIGTGGYVSFPAIRAAAALGIPTFLHEANACPGLAVRRLAKVTDRIFLNFAECAAHLPAGKTLQVGIPLRQGFSEIHRPQARKKLSLSPKDFLIISFGGSLGAAPFNRAIADFMESFCLPRPTIRHLHGYGKRNPEDGGLFTAVAEKTGRRCAASEYLSDMSVLLAAADLAITRAGAVTLAELAAAGVPSILVPSPHVPGDHQTANAKALSERGAALLLPERDLTPRTLAEAVANIYENAPLRERMRRRIRAFAKVAPAQRIAEAVIGFCLEISAE